MERPNFYRTIHKALRRATALFLADLGSVEGKTGEDGEADLKGVSPGTYSLVALQKGWPPATLDDVKVPLEESAPEPVLQLLPGGTLEVRVVDPSKAPVYHVAPRIIDARGRDVTSTYETLAEMADLSPDQIYTGIDGCSAPNFALSLRGTALAFARICQPDGLPEKRAEACHLISNAMLTYPDMIGGPDNFDTDLMQAGGKRVICKGGAEGFQAFGIMPGAIRTGSPALGVAFKVSDGDLKGHNRPVGDERGHVRPAVTMEILRQLGVFHEPDLEKLADYGPGFQIENWRRLKVGWASPCFDLIFSK